MYCVKPYHQDVDIGYQSSTMYRVKPYVTIGNISSGGQSSNLTASEIEELLKIQDRQLRKLNLLTKKSNELCDELNLDNLIIKVAESNAVNSNEIEELYKKQEAQFKRLNRLSEKLNEICEELNLPNLVNKLSGQIPTTDKRKQEQPKRPKLTIDLEQFKNVVRAKSKVNKDKNIAEDLVIKLDPTQYVPHELFVFLDRLTTSFKCFFRFHKHGSLITELSVNSELAGRLEDYETLFEKLLGLGINDSRLSYDFGFTFIWIKSSGIDKPYITVNNKDLIGEEKIAEYINSLVSGEKKLSFDEIKKNKDKSPLYKVLQKI